MNGDIHFLIGTRIKNETNLYDYLQYLLIYENVSFAAKMIVNQQHNQLNFTNINYICVKGYLELLIFLNNFINISYRGTMDTAAIHGHLPMIKWLRENKKDKYTFWIMDRVARYGHLHVLQWLHENSDERCTKYAMNWAAQDGHLDMVIMS